MYPFVCLLHSHSLLIFLVQSCPVICANGHIPTQGQNTQTQASFCRLVTRQFAHVDSLRSENTAPPEQQQQQRETKACKHMEMEHNWPRKPVVLPSLFKSEPHTTLRPLVSVIHRAPSPLQHPRAPPATSSFYHHYHHSCETHRAPQYSRTHESNHIVIKREPTSYGSSYEQQQRYKLPVLSDMLHGGSRHSPQQSAVVSAPTPKSSLSFILDGHAPAAREDQLEDPEYFRASNSSATSSLMSEEDEALMNRYIDQHQHEIMSHHHQPHHEQRLKTNGKRRVSRPASRTCKYEGCDQYVVDHGLCVRHGVSACFVLLGFMLCVNQSEPLMNRVFVTMIAAGRQTMHDRRMHKSSEAFRTLLASWRIHGVQSDRVCESRQVPRLLLVAWRGHEMQV